MFNFPALKVGEKGAEATVQITSTGIKVTTDDGEIHQSEFPAPLRAAVTATAAVGAVTVLAAAGVPAAIGAGVVAAATTAAASNDELVEVNGYHRDDGTYVRSHNRTQPDGWEGNNFSN